MDCTGLGWVGRSRALACASVCRRGSGGQSSESRKWVPYDEDQRDASTQLGQAVPDCSDGIDSQQQRPATRPLQACIGGVTRQQLSGPQQLPEVELLHGAGTAPPGAGSARALRDFACNGRRGPCHLEAAPDVCPGVAPPQPGQPLAGAARHEGSARPAAARGRGARPALSSHPAPSPHCEFRAFSNLALGTVLADQLRPPPSGRSEQKNTSSCPVLVCAALRAGVPCLWDLAVEASNVEASAGLCGPSSSRKARRSPPSQ